MSQESAGQHHHAIILSGAEIDNMTSERRAEVAKGLANLLGVNADAVQLPVEIPGVVEPSWKQTPLPPMEDGAFTLLFIPEKRPDGMDDYVSRAVAFAEQRSPGTITDVTAVRRVLGNMHMYGLIAQQVPETRGHNTTKTLFTFHPAKDDHHMARAVTFLQPSSFCANPEEAMGIRNVGPAAAQALAQFVRAMTSESQE